MVGDLITGIAQGIRAIFPEEPYKIYTERTEQGINEPCFFILCITQSHDSELGDRFMLNISFDIHYFPKNGNKECWEVADALRGILEWITVGEDLIRGINMNQRVENGVLHSFVDYNLHMTHKKIPDVYMGEVNVYGKTRG